MCQTTEQFYNLAQSVWNHWVSGFLDHVASWSFRLHLWIAQWTVSTESHFWIFSRTMSIFKAVLSYDPKITANEYWFPVFSFAQRSLEISLNLLVLWDIQSVCSFTHFYMNIVFELFHNLLMCFSFFLFLFFYLLVNLDPFWLLRNSSCLRCSFYTQWCCWGG